MSKLKIVGGSTKDMIAGFRTLLAQQGGQTPRNTLTWIIDLCSKMLLPLNPPSRIPDMGTIDLTQPQLMAAGDWWLSTLLYFQPDMTPVQLLTQFRDGAMMYLKALPAPTPVPVPTPGPTPAPVAGQIKVAMFVDAAGCPLAGTINTGVSSGLAWAQSHGQAQENAYRTWLLNALQAAGSDTLVYIVDSYYQPIGSSVLAMCLADMGHPADGHHADQTEGWYTRSIAKGVKRHIAIFRDSPDTGVGVSEQAVKDFVAAYKGSRFEVLFSTGLETKRNAGATPAQTAQICRWMKAAAPNNRIIVGDASPDFLLAVAGLVDGIDLWLEQPDSLMARPLTNATAPTYLASLDRLAAKVGAGKTWAGEWWMTNKADRQAFSKQVLAKGYNCGGGYCA